MEVVKCNALRSAYIMNKRIIHENGEVIKYSPASADVLMYMDTIKESLITKHLAMQQREFVDNMGVHLAYSMIDYINYQVLSKYYSDPFLDKQRLFNKIWDVLSNLLHNGIIYTDIHCKNILLNDFYDFKIVDLDSASLDINIRKKYNMLYNFVDLLLECYIFYEEQDGFWYFNNFYNKLNLDEYFSKEVSEMFELIKKEDEQSVEIDVKKLIKAFDDEVKIDFIRNIIYKR